MCRTLGGRRVDAPDLPEGAPLSPPDQNMLTVDEVLKQCIYIYI